MGALLIQCQVESGRFADFRTARYGMIILGKDSSFFLCLVLPLCLSFPFLFFLFLSLPSLKGSHGDTYPMLLQQAGTGPGAGQSTGKTSDQWQSGGSNREARLTLDGAAGRGGASCPWRCSVMGSGCQRISVFGRDLG